MKNSQNSLLLNFSNFQNRSFIAAEGGVDVSFSNSVLKISNSVLIDFEKEVKENKFKKDLRYYNVQSGDTLSGIASKFNISTETIIWENQISKNIIKPGQRLTILPISGLRYLIISGDSLDKLSKKFKVKKEKIEQYNDLEDGILTIGEKIIIPGAKKTNPIVRKANRKVSSSKKTAQKSNGKIEGTRFYGKSGSLYIRYSGKTTYGYWTHPLPGSIRTQGIHGRNSIDMAAKTGTPVLAAAAGKVIKSYYGGYGGGYGNHIIIEHANGTKTLYAHMKTVYVSKNATVVKGQSVGTVGSTGRSTGPHLHFEIWGATNPF